MLAAALPIVTSAGIIAILYTGNLDYRIASEFYDAESKSWPWQGHRLTKDVLHDGGRDLLFLIGVASLFIACCGGRFSRLRPLRRTATLLVLSLGLSTLITGLLKTISPDPSPWSAAGFGGDIVHGTFFASRSPTGALGQASPGAHSSGAFALMSLYYGWRVRDPRRAWILLVAGWLLGSAYGAVQVVRGAHFPSHNYWSCIVSWSVSTLLYWGLFRGRLDVRTVAES